MDKKSIARINELARKSKEVGLTSEEASEQAALRREYIEAVRENFKSTLSNLDLMKGFNGNGNFS